MKNMMKKLSMIILLSSICSTTTFRTYADIEKPDTDVKAEAEMKPQQTLKQAKTKSTKFHFKGDFTGANNIKVKGKELITLDTSIALGMEKKFVFEEDNIESKVEVKATPEKIELEELFLTYNVWTFGLTDSLFTESAIQVATQTKCNDTVTAGLGLEKAKEFSFFATDEKGEKTAEKANLKPKSYIPALSGMVKYNLPSESGDITISGLFRPLAWKDSEAKKTNYCCGFGLKLSSTMPFKSKTRKVTFSGIFGRSIGEYIPRLQKEDRHPVSIYFVKDKKENIMAGSVDISYEHHWTTAIRTTVGLGAAKVLQPSKVAKDAYDLGIYGNANVSYWFTEYTSVGLGYNIGHIKNADKEMGSQYHQIKAILGFKF